MKGEFARQYRSALAMVEEFIGKCDEELWSSTAYQSPVWHVCYHALFYTNIYLAPSEGEILKWEGEREGYHDLKESVPLPYSKGEMSAFLNHIGSRVEAYLEGMEPAGDCWPFWYNQNQLEFHMNNLRHLQHHTGELFERLNNVSPVTYRWR